MLYPTIFLRGDAPLPTSSIQYTLHGVTSDLVLVDWLVGIWQKYFNILTFPPPGLIQHRSPDPWSKKAPLAQAFPTQPLNC